MSIQHKKERDGLETELAILEKRGRDRLFILAEILDIAKQGALKTQVMYNANLSYKQLTETLKLLMDMGCLSTSAKGGKTIYKTTEKGFHYLDSYTKLLDLMAKTSTKHRYVSELYRLSSQLRELKKAIDNIETSMANLKTCPKCNLDIFAEYTYCPYCGTNLTSGTSEGARR